MPAGSPPPTAERARPRTRRVAPVVAALIGLAVGDALRPVPDQNGTRLALAAIDAYRATVSPVLARTGVVRCRFEPTCSAYGREAIARYGEPKGFALAAGRVLRCHPWAKGGWDPVP